MKKQLLTRTVALACVCVGLGLAPAASAAQQVNHFTNYWITYQLAISNELATAPLTAATSNALVKANNTLNRNSRTLSSDLIQVETASRTLDRAYPEGNAILNDAADTTYLLFVAEAQAQFIDLLTTTNLFTNGVPRSVNNQIAQITNLLAKATTTNNISQKGPFLRQALNKIRVANLLASHSIKAPASLEGKSVQLTSRQGRTVKHTTLAAANFNQSPSVEGEWNYQRTSANTGSILLQEAAGTTTYNLTFRTTTTGGYKSETESAVGTNGTFRVFKPHR